MAEPADQTILQRMARSAQPTATRSGTPSAGDVAAALSRAASATIGLSATVAAARAGQVPRGDVAADVGEGHMLVVLEGAEGQKGALILDPSALAAAVEQQTLGHVTPQVPVGRAPTATDAALAAAWIDGALGALAADRDTDGEDAVAWQFGAQVANPRALGLVLEAARFHRIAVTLTLGADPECSKIGQVVLALPVAVPRPAAPAAPPPGRSADLERAVLAAPAQLRAVLDRQSLALSRIRTLSEGDRLTVPMRALTEVRIEAIDGRVIARAALGQSGGFRAVRIHGDPALAQTAPNPLPDGGAVADGTRTAPHPGPASQTDPVPDLPVLSDTG